MKYFYSDPVKAAYMAETYHMEFVYPNGMPVTLSTIEHFIYSTLADYEPPYFIAENSLHLLEPSPGDLIAHKDKERGGAWGFIEYNIVVKPEERWEKIGGYPKNQLQIEVFNREAWRSDTGMISKSAFVKIIQRNEQEFFWPNSEPATNPTSKAE